MFGSILLVILTTFIEALIDISALFKIEKSDFV